MAEEKKLLEIQNLRKYFPINGAKGPVVRLSMTVRQFLTIRWTKTANHLAKRNL